MSRPQLPPKTPTGTSLETRSATPPVVVTGRAADGRLEPVRLGVRWVAIDPHTEAIPGGEVQPPPAEFIGDDFSAGRRRVGPWEIELSGELLGDTASLGAVVRNTSNLEAHLDSVILGFRWRGAARGDLRFLRNGWQSWSFTGSRDLDPQGEPDFPSGGWLRGMHHALGVRALDRAGWHESNVVGVMGPSRGGPACLLGVLETGRNFSVVYLRRDGADCLAEIEHSLEVTLAPGESRQLERVHVALGDDPNRLLEAFAELWGRDAAARTRSPFQAGWCSWYHFFHEVDEGDVLRNLEALGAARDEIPVEVVQIDDGYQSAVGDWLEPNEKFPRGLAPIARDIRSAGFRPGLWTAPFCVVPESRLFAQHPEWLLKDQGEPFRGLIHPVWSVSGWVYALDTSQPEVLEHLEELFGQIVGLGFSYLKLDFLYVAAMRARAADSRMTRAQRLRVGLDAVRTGAGDGAFLLGCGCPVGPAVGVVDGMRIGPDVAPHWNIDPDSAVAGLEPALPAVSNGLRSIAQRVWMHRRLWLNDPDCLMARRTHTQLSTEESGTLASAIAATGGMVVFSDDVAELSAAERSRIRETVDLAKEIDAADSRGVARLSDPLSGSGLRELRAGRGADAFVALLNDSEQLVSVDRQKILGELEPGKPQDLLGSRDLMSDGEQQLSPHESVFLRLPNARRLAVFCDFDGTFSVQDVGATLAKRHLAERRAQLWERLERHEFTAWEYNQALFDGFDLSESVLDEFLASIDLDPGAHSLLSWCEERGVPFRVLSDGFDRNLDHLQKIHGVQFGYDANGLRYVEGRWTIQAGAPNPDCACGTGTCKRGRITEYRVEHPQAFCVHIGNGRVSDLCGALAADLAFAKDTLAPALEVRGAAYEPFETLRDVIATLDRWLGPRP